MENCQTLLPPIHPSPHRCRACQGVHHFPAPPFGSSCHTASDIHVMAAISIHENSLFPLHYPRSGQADNVRTNPDLSVGHQGGRTRTTPLRGVRIVRLSGPLFWPITVGPVSGPWEYLFECPPERILARQRYRRNDKTRHGLADGASCILVGGTLRIRRVRAPAPPPHA